MLLFVSKASCDLHVHEWPSMTVAALFRYWLNVLFLAPCSWERGAYSTSRDTRFLSYVCVDVWMYVWMLIWNYSHSFWARIIISSGISTLPMTQKMLEKFFGSGPPLAGGPQNGKNVKNRTPPTFFSDGMIKLSECTPLTMTQKMLETEKWSCTPFGVSGAPQKGQNF